MNLKFQILHLKSATVALLLSGALLQAAEPIPRGPEIDAALLRASQFLVSVQNPKTGAIHDKTRNETTMSALAILALASIGHQPSDPTPEGQAMKRALDFVLKPENQDAEGYFGKTDGSRMYGHGITTLMLAEMLGMGTDAAQDALIRERCRKAIQLILRAQAVTKSQTNQGGWRYTPDTLDSDMSVTCWQTMALRSCKNAGFEVPKESIDQAVAFIKRLYEPGEQGRGEVGGFGYTGRGHETSTTAEGLLALQVCGDYTSREVSGAGERLLKVGVEADERWFFYTCYYYAQGMHQRGGKFAEAGQKVTADLLLPRQAREGWWEGAGGEERQGGRVYATTLAVLSLAVKNHFLPIYQR